MIRYHLPQVPNLEQLVFAVRCNVPAITFAHHMSHTLSVPNEVTDLLIVITKEPRIPNLDDLIFTG